MARKVYSRGAGEEERASTRSHLECLPVECLPVAMNDYPWQFRGIRANLLVRRIYVGRQPAVPEFLEREESNVFAIKAEVGDTGAEAFGFSEQKTMYGGRHIAKGDLIFVFASENEGGLGLIASGIVTSAEAIPKKLGIARQTPRVSVTIRRTALAKRSLGRSELKHFSNWNDGRPETELNFKFYRQATNKIAGISDERPHSFAASFSDRLPDDHICRARVRSDATLKAILGVA